MQFTPHNYQSYCIQRVVEDPAVGLFLRPGLGKTVITLSAINILKYFRWQVQKVLVVAPKKVAEATWSKEAAKWDHLKHIRTATVLGSSTKRIKALNTPADVYVINREMWSGLWTTTSRIGPLTWWCLMRAPALRTARANALRL